MYRFSAVTLFTATLVAISSTAQASPDFETIRLGGSFTVSDSQTQSIALDGPRYVRNIVVQAQGYGTDSTIEVMVNGRVKGTIYAPGRDPSYVVTIAETARSIEFRHRTGGAMRILDVMGTVSTWRGNPGNHEGGFRGSKDQVIQLALSAMRQVEILRNYSLPEDEMAYLFPIKKNAGLVYVMSTAHGDLSRKTIQQLLVLSDQIDFANRYLSQLMQQDGAFNAVVDLLTVRESIQDLLD
jgi:hypothetical protein